MDVGDWLRSLGLGQYEAAFRDNEIDAEVLPELTDADLEKLGVATRASEAASQGDRGPQRPRWRVEPFGCAGFRSQGRRRRAPTADRDVLRSRGFDRDVRAARSRGHARRSSAAYHKCCASLIERRRRLRRQIHGRRRARLFRLSAGARARRRARGAGRARDRRGRAETGDGRRRAAACAGRDRDRDRGRRRSPGFGRGAGARRRRRHAEPRRAAARDRRARQRRHRRGHAQTAGRPVRACAISARKTSRASPGRRAPTRR